MTGFEIVALASLALCFTALQFAWLLNQCGYRRDRAPALIESAGF